MPSVALENIRALHLSLYRQLQGELQSVAKPFGGNTEEKAVFVSSVFRLISEINNEAENILTTVAEYDWLRSILADWQFALSSILGVSTPVPILQYPKHLIEQTVDNRVWRFLEKQAYKASEERRDKKFRKIFGEAWSKANEWNEAEHLADWGDAEIFLASDIISGRGGYWADISQVPEVERWKFMTATVFDVIQKVWLHDILRVHAYEKWREAGARMSGYQDAHDHFRQASIEFAKWSSSWSKKFQDPESAHFLLEYLQKKFCFTASCEVDTELGNVQALIEKKARRIYDSGHTDTLSNWIYAENYVKRYYSSVCATLISGDWTKTSTISDAFYFGQKAASGISIVNGLEATILVYYIKGLKLTGL